ncbi:hypothetical protein P8845_19605 [Bacillus spizizenii]|uniref:DUF4352 domain-containing protein n=1 Tax=Bacillus spizizenii TaxID=96241 RepID=A0A9Q4HBF0_BACSC|nr:hypothetical protein [Bacillus spizizenii]MCY7933868.1 hypothetical protein [Bacillus spizizenii]MCY8122865.1 hypothetical protein [Bacillus spizizenii]MCY8168812.1 hypothetical protein [Bacillus spizizenii]MCY8229263.1 hypothetical protein [Bacillus spizizenii]
MFKKLGTLLLITSLILLAACKNSEESSTSSEDTNNATDTNTSESQDISTNGPEKVGDVYEIESGTAKVMAISNKEVTAKTGPMQVTVKKVIAAVANEQTPYIEVQLEAENTSDKVVYFGLDDAKLATSTGVQINEASTVENEDFLGEYVGKVNDSGSVFYIFENEEDIKDLDSIRLRFNLPVDEDAHALDDDLDLKINLEH